MGSQLPWTRYSEFNPQMHSQSLSQSVESSRGILPTIDSHGKANWDRTATEAFIKICVEEVHCGNRLGSYFNKTGWENIKKNFKIATNRDYSRQQLKNRWDTLKKEWGWWINLLRGSTGLGWDINKGTVKTSEEWWARKIEMVPEAAKFKIHGPLLLVDQELLFADVVATGESAWAPSSGSLPSQFFTELGANADSAGINEVENQEQNDLVPEPEIEPEADHIEAGIDPPIGSDDTQQTEARGDSNRGKVKNNQKFHVRITQKKKKNMTFVDKLVRSIDRMVDKFSSDSEKCSGTSVAVVNYTIKECMDMIYSVSGIEESDRLWMFATRLFLKPVVRELFLSIRSNDGRLNWLQEQYERDFLRKASSTPSTNASRGESHNDYESSG